MYLYSIKWYRVNKPTLVHIVKASGTQEAVSFLNDHLSNCEGWSGMAFFERHYECGLFDTPDPEIIEILSLELYQKKYCYG